MPGSSHERAQNDDDIAAKEAAGWFARLADDRVSEGEFAQYQEWRAASPAHAAAYDRIASAWAVASNFAEAPSILEMRVAALAESPGRSAKWKFAAMAAAIALVVAAAMILTLTNAGWFSPASQGPQTATIEPATSGAGQVLADAAPLDEQSADSANMDFRSAYSTRIGEMAEFALPDGSSIALNTASQVRVDYTSGQRNLTLVKGEAVFTVARDADRPFVVTAGDSRVIALGTVFAVRRTGEEAQVTLIEGRVRVDQGSPTNGVTSAQLVAGEQLRILADRSFAISKAEIARATSWREGRLVFDRTPLREVLAEFNRYTSEQHVLTDARLGDLLVNGTFRIESSGHFAATLEAGFPVTVRARSGGAILEVSAAQQLADQPSISAN